ncbi:MAG: hypothetical protein IT581_18085 [Verrucomicrobiales bacterium]|nr:hypothetical protein [Verrucomicrobiales bacterium]
MGARGYQKSELFRAAHQARQFTDHRVHSMAVIDDQHQVLFHLAPKEIGLSVCQTIASQIQESNAREALLAFRTSRPLEKQSALSLPARRAEQQDPSRSGKSMIIEAIHLAGPRKVGAAMMQLPPFFRQRVGEELRSREQRLIRPRKQPANPILPKKAMDEFDGILLRSNRLNQAR